jgi:cyanuric acid amidohydrolase
MPTARVQRFSATAPDDVSRIAAAIAAGTLDPAGIVAILGKTEGNGCVNDFTRAFAVTTLQMMLRLHLPTEVASRVCLVMSGGTEGALAPHWLVLERVAASGGAAPALAIGRAHTPPLESGDLGRRAQADMVAAGVHAAMRDAGIEHIADVHFVQVKCPLLTAQRVKAVEAAGGRVATRDTLKSMSLSRAASALGVALALGEIAGEAVTDARIGSDPSLWSARASASAGVELLDHEIVVLGMSEAWSGPLAIDHAVMADQIDLAPVRAAAARLGLPGPLDSLRPPRLVAMLAKAEAGTSGTLRGFRHTMNDDSDIAATRHARAFVGGALAGLVGHAEIFVSGGAEHQGPDGGGPVALIVERAV